MGRIFLQHLGGNRIYTCERCDTFLTNRQELMSKSFTGTTGAAYLFNRVVNLIHSEVHDRLMLTGKHWVRDVSCKKCGSKLGWMYEFATAPDQQYKEGKIILEKQLIREKLTLQEVPGMLLLHQHHHHIIGGGNSGGSAGAIGGSSHHHHYLHHHHHHAAHGSSASSVASSAAAAAVASAHLLREHI